MKETDLHDVLGRATNAIESPALFAGAWGAAQRRRARVRGAMGACAVSLAVTAVVVGVQVAGSERTQPSLPTPSRTTYGSAEEAPPIAPDEVSPVWDPTTVASLPLDSQLALPQMLDPPASATSIEIAPLASAVAAVDTGDGIGLVSLNGSWRRADHPELPLEPAFVRDTVAISPGGETIVFAGATRLWWLDVKEGSWREVPYPVEMDLKAEWDLQLIVRSAHTAELSGYETVDNRSHLRTWRVDLRTATSTVAPYPLDNTGSWGDTTVRLSVVDGRRVLNQWTDATLSRSMFVDAFHSLLFPAVGEASIAAVREVSSYREPRGATDWDGLLAFELDSGETRAYLPVRDRNAWYSRGGLIPVVWLNDDVVVARVIPKGSGGFQVGTAYLVTWNVETGSLARVSSYDEKTRLVLAPDILARP